jgi:hypothetical protein
MDTKTLFIIENLEKKSNTILGFIVVQSLYFADKLSNEEFVQKIRGIKGFYNYLFIAHSIILAFAIIFLLMIDNRISKPLDNDIRKAIQPHFTLLVKIAVAVLFGVIPIIVLLERISH